MPPRLSVVLCTRNPDPRRLEATLSALRDQDLSPANWELVLVDNGSTPPLSPPELPCARLIQEPRPGLTPARLAGIRASRAEVLVLVDDDNVLHPTFLSRALALMEADTALGAAGGRVEGDFASAPPPWTREFFGLLALADHGPHPLSCEGGPSAAWPAFAPCGAGLIIRRCHALAYAEAVANDARRLLLDRRGRSLSSGGDNDLVFTALRAGARIAYDPGLLVRHLIPAERLEARYLAALNRAIQRSWVAVLDLHGVRPWPAAAGWSLPFRVLRAAFRSRPWTGPSARVRFAGHVGLLEGRAGLGSPTPRPPS